MWLIPCTVTTANMIQMKTKVNHKEHGKSKKKEQTGDRWISYASRQWYGLWCVCMCALHMFNKKKVKTIENKIEKPRTQ